MELKYDCNKYTYLQCVVSCVVKVTLPPSLQKERHVTVYRGMELPCRSIQQVSPKRQRVCTYIHGVTSQDRSILQRRYNLDSHVIAGCTYSNHQMVSDFSLWRPGIDARPFRAGFVVRVLLAS
jgi:hypothetical protein